MWTPGVYRPARQIGAVALGDTAPAAGTCPTRSYWWLALAAAAGAWGGYAYQRKAKKGRRG